MTWEITDETDAIFRGSWGHISIGVFTLILDIDELGDLTIAALSRQTEIEISTTKILKLDSESRMGYDPDDPQHIINKARKIVDANDDRVVYDDAGVEEVPDGFWVDAKVWVPKGTK